MSSSDIEYFRQRAAVEHALATAAENANVAAIHAELARGYEALVRHEELRPPLTRPRLVTPAFTPSEQHAEPAQAHRRA